MNRPPVIIKATSQPGIVLLLVLIAIIPLGLIATSSELRSKAIVLIPLLCIAILIFLLLLRHISNLPEIIITEKGISLVKGKFIEWSKINTFRTVHTPAAYRIPARDSIIFTAGHTELKFNITNMSAGHESIVAYILEYSNNPVLHYEGHHNIESL